MMQRKLKMAVSICLCLAMIISCAAIAGCSSSTRNGGSAANDIITVSLDAEPTHLALALSTDCYTVWAAKNINDFLVEYDQNMNIQLKMCKKLDKKDDVTYEFEIYPGIKFHNGREVKADDVKFSLEYIISPESGSTTASYLTCLDNVEVTGDYTGIVHLKQPYASFVNKLIMVPIIPKECVDTMKTEPVGCGPFQFKAWNKDQDIQLVAFKDYWKKGIPKCGGITFKIIKEYNTIRSSFIAGDIDILLWSSNTDIPQWESTKGVVVRKQDLDDGYFIAYNTKVKPFDDARIRKAIALAIDKQKCIDLAAQGYDEVLDMPVFPRNQYYNPDAAYKQDINAAKALLAEAGYPNGFSCSLKVPTTVIEGSLGDVIQSQLKAIGIDCKLEKVDVGVFIDAVWAKKNFELCVTGDGSDGDPDTWLSRWVKTGADNNIGSYSNKKLDELIEKGAAAGNIADRKAAYSEAFLLMKDEQPITYLFGGMLYSATKEEIQGLTGYTNWWFDFDEVQRVKS